jgi:hypothetical protein
MTQQPTGTIVFTETLDNGLHGLIVVGPLGALCGYVGIQCKHPFWEKKDWDCPLPSAKTGIPTEEDLQFGPESWTARHARRLTCNDGSNCSHMAVYQFDCHGGVTYSGRGVNGMREDLWYFGFDCSHLGDVLPDMPSGHNGPDDRYRGAHYVQKNVESLAKQLAAYTLVLSLPAPRKELPCPGS